MDGQISEPIATNQGVRQRCGLSPTLFSIYTGKVTEEWKNGMCDTNGIQLKNKSTIKTVLHADDLVFITKSKEELQMAAH
jgi:hypothetical protein